MYCKVYNFDKSISNSVYSSDPSDDGLGALLTQAEPWFSPGNGQPLIFHDQNEQGVR